MKKRQRSDSTAGQVTAVSGATKAIPVPEWVDVPEDAMMFWRSVTKARAADRWNDADLETAAELARTKASIERLNKDLRSEGDVVMNARGTPVVNPKHNLLETLTRRVVALSRMLQIHSEATQGKSRDQVKGNQSQQKAAQSLEEIQKDDDGLIAPPVH